MLNIPVLIYLDENIKKITDKIGIVYKAFLTTNGSMLSKELLQKVKFSSIQLTFDGLEKHMIDLECPTISILKRRLNLLRI